MKRYLIFAYDSYYPGGGWNDFRASFDTLREAKESCTKYRSLFDWAEIIDSTTGQEPL